MAYKNSYSKKYRKYPKKNQPQTKKVARVYRNWSNLQLAIFDEIANGSGNLHVDAFAGTGKTSTLVEGFYHIPQGLALMVAFNKSIQIELATKAPDNVTVLTLHSLGLKAITKAFGKVSIDSFKLKGYIQAELGDEAETLEARQNLEKAISLSKGYLCKDTEEIKVIMDKHDIDSCTYSTDEFVALVQKVTEATRQDTARIDFDDMIYFPSAHNLSVTRYDWVFIDEAQDLNKAQIDLAIRSVKATGRIISVGDENQAIYGFRGADSEAITSIVTQLNSKRLPLSVTYRCGHAIVKEAQKLVPEYRANESNAPGKVENCSEQFMENNAKAGDFILSRVNAPLIRLCLGFLKRGVPANIQGRDVGKSLTYLITKSKAASVDDFLSWLQKWRDIECMRLAKRRRPTDTIEDKAQCLECLCEGTVSLKEVQDNIKKLFDDIDDSSRIILSSTHKAKGLERNRVFLLRSTYRPEAGKEEKNLLYVAQTRAIRELYYVATK